MPILNGLAMIETIIIINKVNIMSSCCGACGGQDTEKAKQEEQKKQEQQKQEQEQKKSES